MMPIGQIIRVNKRGLSEDEKFAEAKIESCRDELKRLIRKPNPMTGDICERREQLGEDITRCKQALIEGGKFQKLIPQQHHGSYL